MLVLFGAIVTLVFIPWLDTSKVRSTRFRPMLKQFFWLLVADCILLGYLGSQGAAGGVASGRRSRFRCCGSRASARSTTTPSSGLILPIVGLIETPKPLPDSIAKAVLGRDAAAPAAAE